MTLNDAPTDNDIDSAAIASDGLGGVPIIDLADADSLVDQIGSACRDWGFFQVVNHGIDDGRIAAIRDVARRFFALPRETKRQFLRSRDNPWGYYDRELTKEKRDKKEIFDIGPDVGRSDLGSAPFEGSTPIPDQPPEFSAVIHDYFDEITGLADRLVSVIGASLDDGGAIASSYGKAHTSFLRLNFYPVDDPLSGETEERADLGIHHHTDAGALTVLLQDEVPGLQVYRDGLWYNVPPIGGAFTINIGDMVQVWSNDRYKAALHRVRAMTDRDRYSIPYFYNPSYTADIAPLGQDAPHYRPINWGDYRRRRADGDFASYGAEVQISDYRIA